MPVIGDLQVALAVAGGYPQIQPVPRLPARVGMETGDLQLVLATQVGGASSVVNIALAPGRRQTDQQVVVWFAVHTQLRTEQIAVKVHALAGTLKVTVVAAAPEGQGGADATRAIRSIQWQHKGGVAQHVLHTQRAICHSLPVGRYCRRQAVLPSEGDRPAGATPDLINAIRYSLHR